MPESTTPLDSMPAPDELPSGSTFEHQEPPNCSEEAAFEQFYREIAPLLRVIARRRFDIPYDDLGSLISDVFITYLRDRGRVRDARQYLVAATCNACRAYRRKKAAENRLFRNEVPEPAAADPTFDSLATTLALGLTLEQLNTKCRELLHRRLVEEQEFDLIAQEMDSTPGAIRVRLHKCRAQAQKIFLALTTLPRKHAP
jgi:RNA polymerase sigma factor (sigma-70 family)